MAPSLWPDCRAPVPIRPAAQLDSPSVEFLSLQLGKQPSFSFSFFLCFYSSTNRFLIA